MAGDQDADRRWQNAPHTRLARGNLPRALVNQGRVTLDVLGVTRMDHGE